MARVPEPSSVNEILQYVEQLQNRIRETSNQLTVVTDESNRAAQLIVLWASQIEELEEKEMKLSLEYDQVMSNLYILPGYVLAVSSGVSGLLSTDQHLCWFLINIVVLVAIYIAALLLAINVAYTHLRGLQAKMDKLVAERNKLQHSYLDHAEHLKNIGATHPVLKKLENYGNQNPELGFKARHSKEVLMLVILGGLIYAFMTLVTAWYVLCGAQSKDHVPCSPPCFPSANPLEPVPDHLPFSPRVPSLDPYQDI